jgi:hypothetical protein
MYHNLFTKDKIPNDDIMLPYKIFIQLINRSTICPVLGKSSTQIWAYFVDLLDSEAKGNPGN